MIQLGSLPMGAPRAVVLLPVVTVGRGSQVSQVPITVVRLNHGSCGLRVRVAVCMSDRDHVCVHLCVHVHGVYLRLLPVIRGCSLSRVLILFDTCVVVCRIIAHYIIIA